MAYKSNFAQILSKIENEVRGEVVVQTEALDTENRSLVQETKSGRFYGSHQASAPGEPWANWTGATRASFFTEQRDNGFTGVFGAASPIALHLEYGTNRIEARPTQRPALANRQQPILKGFAAALKRGTT